MILKIFLILSKKEKTALNEMNMKKELADIGLIGLAVMGQNLALNMARNGYRVQVYNRTSQKTENYMGGSAENTGINASYTIEDFCQSLKPPRRIILMVKAGPPVDDVLNQLKSYLSPGDLIVDGGNSLFTDTIKRCEMWHQRKIRYIGLGVSGGEEGALWGPSLMPGGSRDAYALIKPVLESIAAKVHDDPCVTYIGDGGAGHFVKMVHNGIEYGMMGLIAEAYDLMRNGLAMTALEISSIFEEWNREELSSYLVNITAQILKVKDEKSGLPLVDLILDSAGQKGTGLWLVHHAFDSGISVPTMQAALDGRIISGYYRQRQIASSSLPGPQITYTGEKSAFITQLKQALLFSILCDFAQGFDLMKRAAEEYRWNLNYGDIARIWRGGCIIRAKLLEDIRSVYMADDALVNLLLAPQLADTIGQCQDALRSMVSEAVHLGRPIPTLAASLAYYDAFRSARLPTNLIQAQRDFFGAHTYARVDLPGVFHTDWKTTSKKKSF